MSTFAVSVTLIHPEHRERSVALDLLAGTRAPYMLLPAEVVAQLGLSTPYARPVELANGERDVYRLGEVRVRLGDAERPTVFLAGPAGCRGLVGTITLSGFCLAVDPSHQRLFPVPAFL